jgi:hypothetical protein
VVYSDDEGMILDTNMTKKQLLSRHSVLNGSSAQEQCTVPHIPSETSCACLAKARRKYETNEEIEKQLPGKAGS